MQERILFDLIKTEEGLKTRERNMREQAKAKKKVPRKRARAKACERGGGVGDIRWICLDHAQLPKVVEPWSKPQ